MRRHAGSSQKKAAIAPRKRARTDASSDDGSSSGEYKSGTLGDMQKAKSEQIVSSWPMIKQVDWRGVICQFLGVHAQADDNALLASLQTVTEKLEAANRSLSTVSKKGETEDISFVTVHRISCGEQNTTELSLGVPWPVKNADGGIHLRGSDLIDHLELFLERNKWIIFVVYRDYQCCQPDSRAELSYHATVVTPDIVPELYVAESVDIVSADLGQALGDLCSLVGGDIPHPDFDENDEIRAPYLWWYWRRNHLLNAMLTVEARLGPYLQIFEGYISKSFGAEYEEVDELLKGGKITAKYMPYLYVPGEIQLSKQDGVDRQFWIAFKAKSELRDHQTNRSIAETKIKYAHGCIRSIQGENWSFDGFFQRKSKDWVVACNSSWEEPFYIQALEVYPLRFAGPEASEALRRRGEMFWECRLQKYVSYRRDSAFRSQNPSDTRYMIDIDTFNEMHPPGKEYKRNRNDLGPDAMQQGQPPPGGDDFILCLPATIPGYHMKKKQWIQLYVDRIEEVEWNTNAFNQLVIDREKKRLIEALVTNQILAEESTDLMSGKGAGLLILLHGPPGTGKTLTAESVAEIARKPLYRVTCGDVGTKPEDVEKYLETVLLLGKTWGCVVLLDEADVFLMQRSTEDFERNALVSVFLRVLEYYDGILILTSNRVGTLDAAFKSRIQLSLQFPPLSERDRREIWNNFIDHIDNLTRSRTRQTAEVGILSDEIKKRLPDLAKEELNGREIRNAVSTARQLAMFEKQPMGYRHLATVVSEMNKFNTYAAELQGGLTDDEIARQKCEY